MKKQNELHILEGYVIEIKPLNIEKSVYNSSVHVYLDGEEVYSYINYLDFISVGKMLSKAVFWVSSVRDNQHIETNLKYFKPP